MSRTTRLLSLLLIVSTTQPSADGETPNWDGAGRIRMDETLGIPRYFLGALGISLS